MRTVIVTGDALTVQDVLDVALGQARAELGPDVPARMEASRAVVLCCDHCIIPKEFPAK